MIPESTIAAEVKSFIQQKLGALEKSHRIKILFAIESGSRAWGFPSTDSDYDVRFVYARTQDDYLSIKQHRDVIETDIIEDAFLGVPLDLNGWDIRKALQLAVKSNAVLIEWLKSPIQYTVNDSVIDSLLTLTQEITNIESIKDHYYSLAANAWKQIEEGQGIVKVKLYCYALRPALALHWARQFGTLPPMDMHSLRNGFTQKTELTENVLQLITLKASAQEGDTIPRNLIIDAFIRSVLDTQPDGSKGIILEEKFMKADKLFRKIIVAE